MKEQIDRNVAKTTARNKRERMDLSAAR